MLEGKCPKCGILHFGWALQNPEHQRCPVCGTRFIIRDNDGSLYNRHPSFIEINYNDPLKGDVPNKIIRPHISPIIIRTLKSIFPF